MKIKEFEALTLKDCLQLVRQDMGPEAVILETQKFRKGGLFGFGARDAVRIIAATGVSVNEPRSRSPQAAARNGDQAAARRSEAVIRAPADEPRTPQPVPAASSGRGLSALEGAEGRPPLDPVTDEKLSRLEREMQQLKTGMDAVRHAVLTAPAPLGAPSIAPVEGTNGRTAGPGPNTLAVLYPALHARLREADVSEEIIQEMLEALPDMSGWSEAARVSLAESALRDLMAGRVQSAGPITVSPGRVKTVTFVGPTGVGKTTTIAKLAAHFALIEKRKVGLLTMDTYRIAAVEQLKTYSQIIEIPVQVVHDPKDIAPALQEYQGFDLVFIDTAGRSQKNIMQVSELKSLVEMAGCETHLVLAASTKARDLYDQVERFRNAGVDRLLFTKLDETTTYGTIYSVAARTEIPVSYITTGQKVPEDIEVADGGKLAAIVMNSAAAR